MRVPREARETDAIARMHKRTVQKKLPKRQKEKTSRLAMKVGEKKKMDRRKVKGLRWAKVN